MSTIRPVGFEEQKKNYQCGAYSFAHAMNLIGRPMFIDDAVVACRTKSDGEARRAKWDETKRDLLRSPIGTIRMIKDAEGGTGHTDILRAISNAGCKSVVIDTYDPDEATKILNDLLQRGVPVILNVEDTAHWYVAAGIVNGKYILLDSFESQIVFEYTHEQLMAEWYEGCTACEDEDDGLEPGGLWCSKCDGYGEDDDERECIKCGGDGWFKCEQCNGSGYSFYGIGVQEIEHPEQIATPHLASFIPQIKRDEILREYWGEYLDNLVSSFGYFSKEPGETIDVAKYLRQKEKWIVSEIGFWAGSYLDTRDLAKEWSRQILVAECYNLKCSKDSIEDHLISFMAAFSIMIAVAYL